MHGINSRFGLQQKMNKHVCFDIRDFCKLSPGEEYDLEHFSKVEDLSFWLQFAKKYGYFLTEEIPIPNTSFVVGIPKSEIDFAKGYSEKLGLPYKNVITTNSTNTISNQRLFLDNVIKNHIKSKVLKKLIINPDKSIWKNAIVVIGDDSIVRGNISRQITKKIFSLGAKEVHWVIGFPQIMNTCHLGINIQSKKELIPCHNKGDPKIVAKEIGANSVNFIKTQHFITARLEIGETLTKSDDIFRS